MNEPRSSSDERPASHPEETGAPAASDPATPARVEEQLRWQNEKLRLLLEISAILAERHEPQALFQALVDEATRLGEMGSAALYLLEGDSLLLGATSPPLPPDFPEAFRRAPLADHPHIERALATNAPITIADTTDARLSAAERQVVEGRSLRSLLFLPLAHQHRRFGVLIIGSVDRLHCFSDDEVALFRTLAGQVALEIERARVTEENRRHIAELEQAAERQRQAEAALQQEEALFRDLFQKHVAVKFLIDPDDGRIVDANEAAARFYGWTQDELRRMRVADINTLAPAQVKAEMEKALAQERMYFEFKHRRADGTVRDVAVYSSSIESAGKPLLHSIVHDITERKRMEAEQGRLVTAIEQAGEAVVITDPAGTIQYVNPAFTAVTGYTRDEAIGRNPRLLKSGEHDRAFYQDLWRTITGGHVWRGRFINRHKNGTLYTEEATISPIMDGSGRITNFVAVKRDISDRLRAEEEQARLREQLQQAQKVDSIGRLAGGVAHDFNNMLNIILGYGEMVLDALHPDDPLRGDVRQIVEAGQRAASLTRQLLAFSRKQALRPAVLDLNDLIRNLDKMLRRLIGEDIRLDLALAPDAGRVLVDPGQLEQVVVNLAVNARDAMPEGGRLLIETANVTLDDVYAAAHTGSAPGDYVLLAVSDTGCGMTRDILGQIFDPFFTTKEQGQGTGLGLSMVYGIVKQSGGNIWVYSEPGRGSTFKIYLPRTDARPEAAAGKPEPDRPAGVGERILVVEDEESLRKLMATLLARLGYSVTLAANGGEAMLLVEEQGLTPDLIITDVVMPNLSGRQLVDRLRRTRPHLKALYMSGYTANAIVHHGVLEDGVAFIQKPFTLRDIAAKVREVLQG